MSLLVGSNNAGADLGISNNFNVMSNFVAVASGTAKTFNINLSGATNVQVAIYSDNAGAPNNLLTSVLSFAGSAGWNAITISDTSIVSGNTYWLAADTQTSGHNTQAVQENPTVAALFKALTYGTSFPNPAGSGYSTATWLLATYLDGTLTGKSSVAFKTLLGVGQI